MKIELRNFKPSVSQSRETLAFTATIYANGTEVGAIRNDGGGGSMRTVYVTAAAQNEVLTFIESLPRDSRWPSLPMGEDIFFSIMSAALMQTIDDKKQAKKDAAFAATAHAKGHHAFRVTWADQYGGEMLALVESKELLTVAAFITRLRSPVPISNVTIVEMAKPGEMSLDEARGVMKMKQVLTSNGHMRTLVERDVAFDWLLARGFTRAAKSPDGVKVYATKEGRAWFHSTPGAGVALLVIAKSMKAA